MIDRPILARKLLAPPPVENIAQLKELFETFFSFSLPSVKQGEGDNGRIEKVDYQESEQRIYINNEKYFEGIAPEVWNYHIGRYQVL